MFTIFFVYVCQKAFSDFFRFIPQRKICTFIDSDFAFTISFQFFWSFILVTTNKKHTFKFFMSSSYCSFTLVSKKNIFFTWLINFIYLSLFIPFSIIFTSLILYFYVTNTEHLSFPITKFQMTWINFFLVFFICWTFFYISYFHFT